ncbi:MAG: SirB2 family protein [Halioglobus sp.]|nr:SirB2 family protein [Halioglobus sp.]
MSFEWLKLLHAGSALLSISGFALRGYWMLTGNPRLRSRPARVLPHILDTLLLASAIGMLVMWQANPFEFSWLSAKIAALLCYIGLGMVAFRFGKTRRVRVIAFGMALLVAAYIVAVAFLKSPWGPLAGWSG